MNEKDFQQGKIEVFYEPIRQIKKAQEQSKETKILLPDFLKKALVDKFKASSKTLDPNLRESQKSSERRLSFKTKLDHTLNEVPIQTKLILHNNENNNMLIFRVAINSLKC